MKVFLVLAIVGTVVTSGGVGAMNPDVRLTKINYQGNGCPAGSVSINMLPNKRAIRAVFNNYSAQLSGQPGQLVKRCKLSMSIELPENRRVKLRQIRFRGFIDLPANAHARMSRNYRFNNSTKKVTNNWQGKRYQEVVQREPFNVGWSECGKDIKLEMDSVLEVISRTPLPSGVGVDSFNQLSGRNYRGERGVKFLLDYTPC